MKQISRFHRIQASEGYRQSAAAASDILRQQVFMYLEEDICKDGAVDYLDGYQERLMLIK